MRKGLCKIEIIEGMEEILKFILPRIWDFSLRRNDKTKGSEWHIRRGLEKILFFCLFISRNQKIKRHLIIW